MLDKFRFETAVTLIGGGPVESGDLEIGMTFADHLVAADGGANAAVIAGYLPDLVIGDMDSLSDDARQGIPEDRMIPVTEQDSTDFQKCLDRIAAPVVLGLGFLGARVDHGLAALSVLVRHRAACVLLGPRDAIFAAPPDLDLELPTGTRLSLFPMAPVTGRSEGLRWPIAGIAFDPMTQIGTSNRVTGPVRLQFDMPGMLVIIPRAHLPQAIAAVRP